MFPTRTTSNSSRDLLRGSPEPHHLFGPILRRQVGQEVGGLPGLIHGREQREVFRDEPLQMLDQIHVKRLPVD